MDEIPNQTPPSYMPPSAPSKDKEAAWKNILTIIFLVVAPIIGIILTWLWQNILPIIFLVVIPLLIGLILMWPVATWSKKTKIIVTIVTSVIIVLAIIGAFVMMHFIFISKMARETVVKNISDDMEKISLIASAIYSQTGSYDGVNCKNPKISIICKDISRFTGQKPVFHSSQNTYCVYTKVLEEGYFCIDKRGQLGGMISSPPKEGYCNGTTSFSCPIAPPPLF